MSEPIKAVEAVKAEGKITRLEGKPYNTAGGKVVSVYEVKQEGTKIAIRWGKLYCGNDSLVDWLETDECKSVNQASLIAAKLIHKKIRKGYAKV